MKAVSVGIAVSSLALCGVGCAGVLMVAAAVADALQLRQLRAKMLKAVLGFCCSTASRAAWQVCMLLWLLHLAMLLNDGCSRLKSVSIQRSNCSTVVKRSLPSVIYCCCGCTGV